ncbi:CaiB/BaiF CoA transferase family protein [Variovorax ginsengisoli]|uniref:CaiB/BaiF CoA-transferase family protein n=1 Tax=Variovorax ginsengisoli TaxID=363844 RepID=A0ABT8SF33_9BURK|nr:CaiB/BaiF CoA-transferase family protein [Variovorax ginsengisoli]MDN8618356.1 CaiB/BaiF CoA-transferase family protein [Variovorax ginsengisoli]MDO1537526.1 CaiB/BaiF CoA-transferase family protein [Variovorax ginsengisoli]
MTMTPDPKPPRATDFPPLAGVRVLDLTRLLPGPVCTMHLADLGADVIKIEDTDAGDYAAPALRALLHRNKRALSLDLKQPEGVAVLHALARSADVLIESFRPGVMDRLGVGYEALSSLNPKLVYCSITGYGQTGPYRDEPGHDLNYCAMAGVSDQVGREGDAPALSNIPMADLIGGSLTSAMGLLAALFDAGRTGRGRHVDIAMADGMLAHAVVPMVTLAARGQTRPAGTDRLSGGQPCYSVYATRDDRHLAVGALERKFWDRFCEVIGRLDLQARHQPADAAASDALRAELTEIIGSQTLAHWQQTFDGTGACVTPVLRLEEALQDPHFRARGLVADAPAGGGPATVACPVKMSGYSFSVRRPAPQAGQHNAEILAEAGYGADAIAALERQGVVG